MRKSIHNPGLMPIFVNGTMIPGGESRDFDEADLPPEHREPEPPPVEDVPPDPLAELVKASVKVIVAGFETLSDEDLARLQAIETDGQARKSLLEAIAAEQLKRADAALDKKTGAQGGEQTGTGEGEGGEGGKGGDGAQGQPGEQAGGAPSGEPTEGAQTGTGESA